MSYVDGFVLVVPKGKVPAYRAMARRVGRVWKRCGAVELLECMGDDLAPKGSTLPFPTMTRLKKGETVFFSFIVYRSRAHRDRVNAKVMKDPVMTDPKVMARPMPLDMKRVAYGGFRTVVQYS